MRLPWQKDDGGEENKGFDPHSQPNLGAEEHEEESFDPKAAYSALEDRLNREFDDRRRRDERFLQALERIGQQPKAETKVEKTEIDWDDLPDPVAEPDKFRKALKDKTTRAIEATKAGQEAENRSKQDEEREQRRIAGQLEDVWDSFQDEYPDLAKRERLLKGIVGDLVEKGMERGLTREQVILADPESFKAKVVSLASEELGISPEQFRGKSGKTGGRTMGIPGGTARATGGKKADTRSDYVSEIREAQSKTGLFH